MGDANGDYSHIGIGLKNWSEDEQVLVLESAVQQKVILNMSVK